MHENHFPQFSKYIEILSTFHNECTVPMLIPINLAYLYAPNMWKIFVIKMSKITLFCGGLECHVYEHSQKVKKSQ